MRNKSFGTALIAAGIALILGSAGLTLYNFWTDDQAGSTAEAALEVMQQQLPTQAPEAGDPLSPTAPLQTEVEIPDHILNPQMDMPEQEIDGVAYIGYIELPTLEITLPVISQDSEQDLKLAPCRYEGSVYQDNLIIAGHNYRKHFGRITRLSIGDPISFVDMDGNRFQYQVMDMEVIQENQIDTMLEGDWDLTLFTCTMSRTSRYTVRCERVQ